MHTQPSSPRWIALGVFALLFTGVAKDARAGFAKRPHLQNVRTDGITIVWEQDNPGPGVVTIQGTDYPSPSSGTIHEVWVSGLGPATSYDYSVTADGATEGGHFKTAPVVPVTPFAFVAMGDNRTLHVDHQIVVDAVLNENIDFLVNTGDMVSSGEVAEDWQFFFGVEDLLIRNTPWFPTVGNHEEEGGNLPIHYTNYLAPPIDTSGNEAYYSFKYANSAFIVLDGHVNAVDQLLGLWTDYSPAQKTWLNAVLSGYRSDPAIQHIFVFNHEPPYSSKEGRTGNHALRLLIPTFLQYRVDAIICGHDHYLERGSTPQGLIYFTMGGGGAPVYVNDSEGNLGNKAAAALPWLDDAHSVQFAKSTHGYMRVSVNNGQVDIEIKDTSGAVLDQVSWNTGDVVVPDAGAPDTGGADAPGADVLTPDVTVPDAGTAPDVSTLPDVAVTPDAPTTSEAAVTVSPPPAGSGDDGGCSCQAVGAPRPASGAWLTLLAP